MRFFEKFGMLCFLETPVLKFAFLPYYRHINAFGTYVCVSGGKKCPFFGKFGVLCFLEILVLRFAFLPYYRSIRPKILLDFAPEIPSYDFFSSTSILIFTTVRSSLMEMQLIGTLDTVYSSKITSPPIKIGNLHKIEIFI